ncbi:MAG: glutamine--fructose-6-phosphate transaminase (isomerizing) [Alphaproteobacteria bacterium]|nr:glutamine--fructose-6-phosphate transaminase (isomerizing) [Alphaproteobacteria bacterium]
MCGIIAILGTKNAVPHLVEGLKRLEYRGYDSSGVATLVEGHLERRRAEGKLLNLEKLLGTDPLQGIIGIGHTRWATHGKPSDRNAHPMMTDKVAVVHNGIIENFQELKKELQAKGHQFTSDTDTEVVACLLTEYLNLGFAPKEALQKAVGRMEGAYAIAAIIAGHEDMILCARKGSPLVVGHGDGEMFIGSDAIALAPLTRKLTYLEEGDWGIINRKGAEIFDEEGRSVHRPITIVDISSAVAEKGNYDHFMLKEIFEQAEVLPRTLHNLVDPISKTIRLPNLAFQWKDVTRLTFVACGTSYHSAMVAKYWFEQIAKIPVDVDIASEFRYRSPVLSKNGVSLFISQSGETIDTLAALRYAKSNGQHILSIVNRPESTMARESDAILQTLVGPEIGVASTKAFTGQLVVLACLALAVAKARGTISSAEETDFITSLASLPNHIRLILKDADRYHEIAASLVDAKDVLYLGRGTAYPVALEGALKLKEISYIHAEGYASGEMKHGPIALIDKGTPVIMVAPSDALIEKSLSNLEEVVARGAHVILLSDDEGISKLRNNDVLKIRLPKVNEFLTPILYTIPVQLLAYYVAVLKGTDVDQPRNLAKSVTVE